MTRSAAWTRERRRATPWNPRFWEGSPVFAFIAEAARAFDDFEAMPSPAEIDAALATRAGVRFVEQRPRPSRGARAGARGEPGAGPMYDASIVARGEVPTRAGSWHDLMNALVWATMPRSKRALHARQERLVVPGAPSRTRELDALALLDEGGVLSLGDRTVVFGHGIYEVLVLGARTSRGAMVELAGSEGGAGSVASAADAALAAALAEPGSFADPSVFSRAVIGA